MRSKTSLTKKLLKSTMATLLTASVISSSFVGALGARTAKAAPAAPKEKVSLYNLGLNEKKWLQPTAPTFTMDSLMEWTPESDPDAQLNRATVPLNKNRFRGHIVNPKASDKASIMNCSIANWSHDLGSSVGGDDFNFYAFDYWQYLGIYIYWSGSAHGIITVPTPDLIDSAHREGVLVHGMLGFPWGGSSEGLEQLRKLIKQDPDGSYPVMDKLMQVADYFGFDGWFFNQETFGGNSDDAQALRNAMIWAKKKYPNLTFSWYDSMSPQGGVNYQNALNDSNKWWMEKVDGVAAVDYFFLNYNWGDAQVTSSVNAAESIGRSPFDVYGGLEVQQASYNTTRMPVDKLPGPGTNGKPRISIALFAANSTMGIAKDPADFHNQENIFYTGWEGDPTISGTQQGANPYFKGMSRFVADSSVITTLPFYTDFNSGHGKKYFRDGVQVRDHGWNGRFAMRTNPTWRWWVRSTKDSKLSVHYDFDTAYNGGNSFRFHADTLAADNSNKVMLYSTKLQPEDGTKALVTYKGKPGMKVSLILNTNEDYSAEGDHVFALPDPTEEWNSAVVDVSSLKGQTVYAMALKFDNAEELNDYSFNLGELGMYNERVKPGEPSNAVQLAFMPHSAYEAEARLYWDKGTNVAYYEVYQDRGDGKQELVNTTTNNYFYSAFFKRNAEAKGTTSKITIVPVSEDGTRGEGTILNLDWGMTVNDTGEIPAPPVNVCYHTHVTGVSFANSGEPADKAFDGTAKGNSKWCASNRDSGWVSIDLGAPKTIRRVRIEHAEYGGEAANMNSNAFHLEYKKPGESGWTVLDQKIDKNAPEAVTDVNLDPAVTAEEWKLVIEDAGSSPWGAVRIYEWQMFETPVPAQVLPMQDVTATNNEGATDQVVAKEVPAHTTLNLFRHIEDKEPFASQKNDTAAEATLTFDNLDLGADEGILYYDTQKDGLPVSIRLAAFYGSEQNSVKREDVTFTPAGEGKMDVTFNGLVPGESIYLVDKHGYRLGPVAEGQTSLTYKGYPISVGETMNVQAKQPKLNRSDVYEVTAKVVNGSVSITVSTEDNLPLTGAEVKIMRNGELVDSVSSVSDSPVVVNLPGGTYTLQNTTVGFGMKGYVPDSETQTVQIKDEVPVQVHFTAKKVQQYFDLKALVEANKDKDLTPYTDETAEAFRKAYGEAQALLEKDTQAAEAYAEAIKNLNTAIEGLKEKEVPVTLDPVTNLKAEKDGMNITVSWTASEGAEGYELYRKAPGDEKMTPFFSVSGTSITESATEPGTYFYRVLPFKHVDGKKIYGPSNEYVFVTLNVLPPAKVKNVKLSVSNRVLALTWDRVPEADGYIIYRMIPGQKNVTEYTKVTGTKYTEKAGENGRYIYLVQAYIQAGKKTVRGFGSEAIGITVVGPAAPARNLQLTQKSNGRVIELTWDKAENADGYLVYRRGPGDKEMKYVYAKTTTIYQDVVKEKGIYFYAVISYRKANGEMIISPQDGYKYTTIR